MKIIFQSRIDLFSRRGGDTVQMERTADELEKLEVEVDIDNSPDKDLWEYDLVHLFNIDWPANVYLCAKNAKKQGKPIVFSPIHHSFEEIERYEKEYQFGLRRIVNTIFREREAREKFKDFCRTLTDPKKIPSTVTEFRKGVLNEQQELLDLADIILVQTRAEADDLEKDFSCNGRPIKGNTFDRVESTANCDFCWRRVVNGVDRRFADVTKDCFVEKYGWENFVLCVGRIEPRKNQLAVIEAVRLLFESQLHSSKKQSTGNKREAGQWPAATQNTNVAAPHGAPKSKRTLKGATLGNSPLDIAYDTKLIFVGKVSWRHPEYALRFKSLVNKYDWIKHIERIPYEKMGSAYAAAKVHVSASWFETTGLVSLEAGLAGCNVVASGDRAKDYLEGYAHYCDPGNPASITEAIEAACSGKFDPDFKKHVLENFTWDQTAAQTLEVYERLLG